MNLQNLNIRLRVVVFVVAALVLGVFVEASFVMVDSGNVGVVTHFGEVQPETLPEGLHFITPVKMKIVPLSVRIQKIEASASASSKDLQNVTSKVALNYFLSKEQANKIYQDLGLRYEETIVTPLLQEAVKSTTAQFTAEELITRRSTVKDMIFEDIKARLDKYFILVTDFSITDFSFSPEFSREIEEKQVAEQRALRAKNDLERVKTEALQMMEQAKGEAQARLEVAKADAEAQSLLRETVSEEIIQLRAVEKWDGKLPQMMTNEGSLPFVPLPKGSQ